MGKMNKLDVRLAESSAEVRSRIYIKAIFLPSLFSLLFFLPSHAYHYGLTPASIYKMKCAVATPDNVGHVLLAFSVPAVHDISQFVLPSNEQEVLVLHIHVGL